MYAPPMDAPPAPDAAAAAPPTTSLHPGAEFAVHRPDSSIFKRGGVKREAAADTVGRAAPDADDAASLKARLAAMHAAWAAPRAARGVTVAAWRPRGRVAASRAPRSKLAPRMGFHAGGVLHLHPEEAAFLADRGDAVVVVGGDAAAATTTTTTARALSIQEAWTLSASTSTPLTARVPYAVLMRGGFVVRRAPPQWYLPSGADLAASWTGPGWVDGAPRGVAVAAVVAPAPTSAAAVTVPPRPPPIASEVRAAKRARVAVAVAWQAAHPAPPGAASRAWWAAAGEGHPWCCVPPPLDENSCIAVVAARERPPPPAALPRLRPFGATQDGGPDDAATTAPAHALAVHRCAARFARRRPAPPASVVTPSPRVGAPPTRAECWGADGAAAGVPARWAVVNGGGASFFGFHRVTLADAVER